MEALSTGYLAPYFRNAAGKVSKAYRLFGRANMQAQPDYNPSLKKINVLISLVVSHGRQIQHFGQSFGEVPSGFLLHAIGIESVTKENQEIGRGQHRET